LLPPLLGGGQVIIIGDEVTPSNVRLYMTGTVGISAYGGGQWTIAGVKIECAAGVGLSVYRNASVSLRNVSFSTCGAEHIKCSDSGFVQFLAGSANSIVGNATAFVACYNGGSFSASGIAFTVLTTPAFSAAFVVAQFCGTVQFFNASFTGSATGVRYIAQTNGVIQSPAGGATNLPGNSAGSVSTGGQYV
jgi:hypothetical protein